MTVTTPAWRFATGVVTHVIDGTLFVTAETGSGIFEGPAAVRVADLLDGVRSEDEITRAAADVDAEAVAQVLRRLRRGGYIVARTPPDDDAAAYVEGLAARGAPGEIGIRPSRIEIMPLGSEDAAVRIADAVEAIGCSARLVDPDATPDCDLLVVVAEDYLDPRLATINGLMLATARPWLVVKPYGGEAWIGPRFVPGETGCWMCLSARLSGNRTIERFIAQRTDGASAARPSSGVLPGIDGMVAAMVVADILATAPAGSAAVESATAGPTPLTGRLRTVTLTDFTITHHPLTRLPHCPMCGDRASARRPAEGLRGPERSRPWTHRALTPDDIDTLLRDQIGPYLGVVSKLTTADRRTDGSGYTCLATHDFPMIRHTVSGLRRSVAARSSGRGTTLPEARATALCEAMERYCGAWVDGTPTVRSSWDRLDRRAIHPAEVLLFSDAQYVGRAAWNADPVNALHHVPEVFDEAYEVDFSHAWSLTRKEPVLVPAGLVWYGHPDLRTHPYAMTDSNGCAAGGNLPEATLHALCEIYERDAVAIWWYNRLRRPSVDLGDLDDPHARAVIEACHRAGRSAWVLDITTDLGMPTYAAVSCDGDDGGRVLFGFGAHPDGRRAIRRALAEMDQLQPLVSGDNTARYAAHDPATLRWLGVVTCADEPWLRPAGTVAPRDQPVPDAIGDVIGGYVGELARAGIETVLVDQSRPDIGIAVARVLAPGMRHFWRRTAPGRLYDVPVALGWRPDRTPEADLNPYSVFI
jgi:ribosomal protein S12 methylthiotransferase accessory factor